MNKSRITTVIACLLPALGGCSGIYYASEAKPTNLVPPAETRYVAPAGTYQNDLTALVGTFAVYNKADQTLQVLEPVANPYDPRTRPVVETVKQTLYSSVVDQSIQTDIPLINAALKDAAGETLDVTITDEAHAMVPNYSVDVLSYIGSRYRPTNQNEEIVYVAEAWQRRFNAALLTAKEHSAWTANTGVVVYNNKTYTRTEAFKDASYLTVSVVPYSKIQAAKPGTALEALPVSAISTIKPQMLDPYAYTWHRDGWGGYGYGYGGYGYGYGHGHGPAKTKPKAK
ncbi:hypothetical protein CCC_01748 [Paramagnetospirillum magnetotacticum MS-1]|uniref:Uncharacterized protein n=1 Tax=Paramagnetospirillum magnetotacticum MS-1 TaxID=272627 RepID=A0A0C2Z067_PARME|nr:hypothetical protein [Paramagnetospirillum magnetotacticum]KIM00754.1 hypothetical protein CCC_01748 [Paramagnetospirillum magnetotacticum MS-1]